MTDMHEVKVRNSFTLREWLRRLSRKVEWGVVAEFTLLGMAVGAVIGAVIICLNRLSAAL